MESIGEQENKTKLINHKEWTSEASGEQPTNAVLLLGQQICEQWLKRLLLEELA